MPETDIESVNVLIVDDERPMRSALQRLLRPLGCRITALADGRSACNTLGHADVGEPAVAIVDLCMPGMDGLEVLAEIKRRSPRTQVLLLSGHATVRTAVRAMRLGADDVLEKPFEPEALLARIQAAIRVWTAQKPSAGTQGAGAAAGMLVGRSGQMRRIRELAMQLARTGATVLIQGESGTGKEEFAKAVHAAGDRAREPFVPIDMSAIPETMIESELFGHVKGAFTGAEAARDGLLRVAGRGSVLLDEITELPFHLQAKLLRVLQELQARPVGSERPFVVEARIMAATNRDLAAEARGGRFREDLYNRLNVVCVTMPPLRDRRGDIPPLADHFLNRFQVERPEVAGFAPGVLAALTAYDWPGNVRELQNAILRALVIGRSELIGVEDLPPHIARAATAVVRDTNPARADIRASEDCLCRRSGTLQACEKEAILAALERSSGNRRRAAQLLGIGAATLYRKMKKYSIN